MELAIKRRSYHVISGRLRIELYGLKNNPDVALQSENVFSSIKGILYIETNIITGKFFYIMMKMSLHWMNCVSLFLNLKKRSLDN